MGQSNEKTSFEAQITNYEKKFGLHNFTISQIKNVKIKNNSNKLNKKGIFFFK